MQHANTKMHSGNAITPTGCRVCACGGLCAHSNRFEQYIYRIEKHTVWIGIDELKRIISTKNHDMTLSQSIIHQTKPIWCVWFSNSFHIIMTWSHVFRPFSFDVARFHRWFHTPIPRREAIVEWLTTKLFDFVALLCSVMHRVVGSGFDLEVIEKVALKLFVCHLDKMGWEIVRCRVSS